MLNQLLMNNTMMPSRLFSVSVLVMLISGCAVPGSHVNNGSYTNHASETSSREASEQLAVQAITPELIQRLKPTHQPQRVNLELDQAIANYDYRVGNGDVLNITVWDHPELTIPAGSYRSAQDAGNWVHNDGTIYYPYVGNIKVAGLLVTEIRDLLASRLAKYIESPQIDVSVAAFRSQRVYITGEVNKAGQLPLTNIPLTALDAVNYAGGLNADADWENVILSRNGNEFQLSLKALYEQGDLTQNYLLQHNDVIHVSRNDHNKVFVLGEVSSPQPVSIQRQGITLAEALAETGGIDEGSANASGIFVIRANNSSKALADVYQMDISDARALVFADQFPLQARDIVYVTAEPVARWNRVLSQLIPTISAVNEITEGVQRVRSF